VRRDDHDETEGIAGAGRRPRLTGADDGGGEEAEEVDDHQTEAGASGKRQ
jgi:hypothetical protein